MSTSFAKIFDDEYEKQEESTKFSLVVEGMSESEALDLISALLYHEEGITEYVGMVHPKFYFDQKPMRVIQKSEYERN